MADVIITDPTLAVYHAPLSEAERVYFAARYTADGELVLTKVVEPVNDNSAALRIKRKDDDDQQTAD
jgi:hypothetical protein